ncbi:MAG: prepilin-type N-terminal cleavage/methylation domain-containing protein [Candidatus Eisenbacteria bacterium]
MSMLRNRKGFTLVELMVVVIIVLVLAGIAVPVYIHYIQEGKKSEAYAVIDSIVSGALVYFQKHNTYEDGTIALWLAADDVANARYFTYAISDEDGVGFVATATAVAAEGLPDGATIVWTHEGADASAGSAGSGEFTEDGW